MKIYLLIAIILLSFKGLSQQYNKVRKVWINTKDITIVDGFPWDYDEPVEADVFNNYMLLIEKDSNKVNIVSLTKNFYTPGTRNVLEIDSTCRPVEFSGNVEYNKNPYVYKWHWNSEGRLTSIEELKNGKLIRRISIAPQKKMQKSHK